MEECIAFAFAVMNMMQRRLRAGGSGPGTTCMQPLLGRKRVGRRCRKNRNKSRGCMKRVPDLRRVGMHETVLDLLQTSALRSSNCSQTNSEEHGCQARACCTAPNLIGLCCWGRHLLLRRRVAAAAASSAAAASCHLGRCSRSLRCHCILQRPAINGIPLLLPCLHCHQGHSCAA